jgi:hypothetical protein
MFQIFNFTNYSIDKKGKKGNVLKETRNMRFYLGNSRQ